MRRTNIDNDKDFKSQGVPLSRHFYTFEAMTRDFTEILQSFLRLFLIKSDDVAQNGFSRNFR